MKILSIHDGHCASACYLSGGKIVYLLQEERFTGIKNQGGFPAKSFEWMLGQPGFDLEDLDAIIIGSYDLPVYDWRTRNSIVHRLFSVLVGILPNQIVGSKKLIKPFLMLTGVKRKRQLDRITQEYGLPAQKIRQVEHHLAHGYAALYGSGFVNTGEPILVFTSDNSGDGLSSTVGIWEKTKGYKRIHSDSAFNSLGQFYSRVTEHMGMKPGEHEYKLMGMAPYASGKYSEEVFHILKDKYIDLSPCGFKFVNKASHGRHLLKMLKDDLYMKRFDNICGGLQKLFESLMIEWVKNWAKKTGIRKAVFGGGCFMNVKANMLISEIDDFDKTFFMPSAGDESTSVGAAYKVCEENNSSPVYPIEHLYLGPRYPNGEVETALKKYSNKIFYERKRDIERAIVDLLIDYKIVGRFKGNAEWGARALGNRSILCRADDLNIIQKLNKCIKMRDFWMPFAVSILAEDANKYIINSKQIPAPYMMLTFNTSDISREHLSAGLHPFDHTCRPQVVEKEHASDYHRLISLFKERTGIGGILNTSFNLHGYPIVGTPEYAIEILFNSNLDYIAIEDFLVWAKPAVQPGLG